MQLQVYSHATTGICTGRCEARSYRDRVSSVPPSHNLKQAERCLYFLEEWAPSLCFTLRLCVCVRGIDCSCEQAKGSYNIKVYIYVHSKCMLLCSLLERESAHGEPSIPQTYRAVHILGPTIRSGQLTIEYSYIPNRNTDSGLQTARIVTS